ncbi:hypothetical protein GCM10007320_53950 [Pseudorhodoferax aquiterrae]|uniref:histidine kinase n=1 Tax=Pseudorhodoferax aquiterrae TaxID=747304 RepID=A0ABQ3G9E2_9BURK|nr:ATP-binding protein [Pseudorhodoferax aquiterrae]GHC98351.1 hypothetical protein GCM10007320_53950 [Pseudorhodoferax aquiterrae]
MAQAEKLRLVGQLGAGLAHDLNNILQVVTGRLTILRRRIGEAGEADIQVVRRSVKKAEALTRQLSLLSTQRTLTLRSIVPGDELARIADTTKHLLGAQHTLVLDIGSDLPALRVDPLELEIAVTNLVTNARDALVQGGVIELSAQARLSPNGDTSLAVTVRDSGIGIGQELQERIFEPFFTTKPQGKGTGLGLAQVAAFVESAKGAVEVISAVGDGTRVTLVLPGNESGQRKTERGSEPSAAPDMTGTSILLVDDNDDVRDAADQLLSTYGFVVRAVRSGEEALKTLRAGFNPDFVVSDIVMDGMHGVELVRTIRRSHPHVRSVLVSGHSDIAQAAIKEGFVVIAKPYDISSLLPVLMER